MPERFSQHEERQLLSAVKDAAAAVADGQDPSEAVALAAIDHKLAAEMLPLAVSAYNLGRQNFQRDRCGTSGVSCLMESYPLADLSKVASRVFPEKTALLVAKAAADNSEVCGCYSVPPAAHVRESVTEDRLEEKLAWFSNDPPPRLDPILIGRRVQKAKSAAALLERKLKQACHDTYDELLCRVDEVVDYIKRSNHRRYLPEIAYNSRAMWGSIVEPIFQLASQQTKEAYDNRAIPICTTPCIPEAAPYSLVKAAIDAAVAHATALEELEESREKLAALAGQLDPFPGRGPAGPPSDILRPVSWETSQKSAAGFMSVLSGGVSGGIAGSMRNNLARPTASLVSDMAAKIDDPAHRLELRNIQTRAMLADLLANDDVISSYDPDDVTTAYNEIAQLSPAVADQAAIIRPMLRKRLAGGALEMFDAQQMTGANESLRKSLAGTSPAADAAA